MRVSPETVIVRPETDTVPVLAVAYPVAVWVIDGGLQPDGTVTVTDPPLIPPAAVVYVNVTTWPVDFAETAVVGVLKVPEPFAAPTTVLAIEAPHGDAAP